MARFVIRQQRRHIHIEREQIAHRIVIFRAIHPPERFGAARIRFFRSHPVQRPFQGTKQSVVDGKVQLDVECGTKELTFVELDLLAFGRNLVVHQNGFRAQDAVHWAEPGKTYSWEQVSELLDTLLAEGILQRMP